MKRNFKIAIFSDFEQKSGGGYNEAQYLTNAILHKIGKNFDILLINNNKFTEFNTIVKVYKKKFYLNKLQRFICYIRNFHPIFKKMKKLLFKNKFEYFLKENGVDLVIFTGPSQYSLYLESTDFIITIPDICHLENNEFPEWAKNGEFDRREEIIINAKKAYSILTNAKIIGDKLIKKYNFEEDKISIISQTTSQNLINANSSSGKIKEILPKDFIFYPAMYLPHKNHKLIIDSIEILNSEKKNMNISAVFCGDDKGYLNQIKKYVFEKNLQKKIIFLNFISSEEMVEIYKNCFVLAMPTFSGPTNIPPWEAFYFKKPVLYSKIYEIEKEYKDAVYYIDPYNVESLVDALCDLKQNKNNYAKYQTKGMEMIENNNFDLEVTEFLRKIHKLRKTQNSWKFLYDA